MNILGSVLNSGRFSVEAPHFADFVDSVNSVFTSNFLIVLALIGSYKQFGGHPIECLTPDSLPFVGTDQVRRRPEKWTAINRAAAASRVNWR